MIRWAVETPGPDGQLVPLEDVGGPDKRTAREVARHRWRDVEVLVVTSPAELEVIAEEERAVARDRGPAKVSHWTHAPRAER